MGFLLGLFGTSLPDVRSQDLTAGSKDNVCSGVMSLKLRTSRRVYGSIGCLANRFEVGWKLLVNLVEHALSNLNAVNNIVDLVNTLDSHSSCVILLTTRSWVEATLIENHQVTFVFFELIGKDLNDLSSEVHLVGVVEVDTFGLWQMESAVKNLLRGLHDFFLASGNLVIQVARGGSAREFSNRVDGDTPGSHCNNPVIDRQFVLFLLE